MSPRPFSLGQPRRGRVPLRGGSRGEKEQPTACPPGRDYQARHPALSRPVRDGRGEISGRVAPDASRYSGGAQAPIRRHVPEAVAPVWRLAGSVDAVTGSLRPEEGRAKQEGHGTRGADRALETGRRNSGLEIGPVRDGVELAARRSEGRA